MERKHSQKLAQADTASRYCKQAYAFAPHSEGVGRAWSNQVYVRCLTFVRIQTLYTLTEQLAELRSSAD